MSGNGLHKVCTWLALVGGAACSATAGDAPPGTMAPSSMPRIGTVDERFQSFNVEMVEVTGGNFWKPYGKEFDTPLKEPPSSISSGSGTPTGTNPALYAYRPPIDLTDSRLRKLAAALGPTYMRVSGSWANATYFANADKAPLTPPKGFDGVLSHQQWQGVIDFARAVDAKIVTSFATSPGTRDAAGIWTPEQANRFFAYTKSIGGSIAAAEFMNEPTDTAAYERDFAVFRQFVKQAVPEMMILGPGSIGEATEFGAAMTSGSMPMLKTVDAFSYHHYGTVSKRCAGTGIELTTPDAALSEEWLSRTDRTAAFYENLRDRFQPGKPLWLTETAEAACGGDPWASTFLDSFRYLDQLGRLAKRGVQVVIHNTLASSDYGLLDENTLDPRPNYWGALLWRKLIGATVLDPGVSPIPSLHIYAHCLRGRSGAVALLIINTDLESSGSLDLPTETERYTLAADDLSDTRVQLNGSELKLSTNGDLPLLTGVPTPFGRLTFGPASITFLAVPSAANASCR
jgi:heparanase